MQTWTSTAPTGMRHRLTVKRTPVESDADTISRMSLLLVGESSRVCHRAQVDVPSTPRYADRMKREYKRLTQPLVRDGGALRPASWDEALARAAGGFRDVTSRHGATSF